MRFKFFAFTPSSINFCVKKGNINVIQLPKRSILNMIKSCFLKDFKYSKRNFNPIFCLPGDFKLKKIFVGVKNNAIPVLSELQCFKNSSLFNLMRP